MKCGICGKDTRLGYHGEQVPIYDAHALAQHKKYEHTAEYRAAKAARLAKAQTANQDRAAEAQRVSDARLAASRPVVARLFGSGTPIAYASSKLSRWDVRGGDEHQMIYVRFPDAEAYEQYLSVMATIAGLEAEARVHLTAAWEMGTPVTLEHLDELDRAAIAKASPQA